MVNKCITIVNNQNGLCIFLGPHLLSEKSIVKTKAVVKLEGNRYHVDCIKSWNGDNSMKLIFPKKRFWICIILSFNSWFRNF